MTTDQGELLPDAQYINVRFNSWDRKSYVYENPYTPVKAGDTVHVSVSDGMLPVTVTSIAKKPNFKCKQIQKPTVD
jgi:hypothetical protein